MQWINITSQRVLLFRYLDSVTLRRPSPSPPPSSTTQAHLVISKNDSLAERVRKVNNEDYLLCTNYINTHILI